MEDQCKPVVDHQRRLTHAMRGVVKKHVIKLLNARIIYPVPHREWVSPVHCVPKKGGLTVVKIEKNKLILQRTVIGWQMCIDYRKLNKATKKDHFPLPFIDEMLERLANHAYFCFLDGYSGFMQIPIHPDDQHKITFTCPYGTFAYRRMPFSLCSAPASFNVILDFSKITKPLTHLLQKDVAFDFDEKCLVAFRTLKSALVSAPIIQPPDWSQPFETMCDASDYAVGAVWVKERKAEFMSFTTLVKLLVRHN
jgi:hypothetical protein